MSVDKLVDSTQLDADLTSVANAIRTKGGTSAQLAFPSDFVQAIEDIETGGGDPYEVARKMASRSITSYIDDSTTSLGMNSFSQCTSLATFRCHNVTYINSSCLSATAIRQVAFPKLTSIASTSQFQNCKSLTACDLGGGNALSANMFSGDTAFNVLVLRKSSVIGLGNINAFNNTPFASGKSGGTLYVPQSLVSSYQSATNWSTILGYANNQILPIEGSIYETQYVDGTPIPTT